MIGRYEGEAFQGIEQYEQCVRYIDLIIVVDIAQYAHHLCGLARSRRPRRLTDGYGLSCKSERRVDVGCHIGTGNAQPIARALGYRDYEVPLVIYWRTGQHYQTLRVDDNHLGLRHRSSLTRYNLASLDLFRARRIERVGRWVFRLAIAVATSDHRQSEYQNE